MDTGFKRLWARKRNKARSAQSSTSSTAQSAKPAPEAYTSAPNGDLPPPQLGRPSVSDLPRPSNSGMGDYARPTGLNAYAAQTARNKVQPMLIGISRPSTDVERPFTSGSLQRAIDRAADKAAQSTETSRRTKKPPRYIDIFEISSAKQSSSYNEDVAERNLDMVRVALESGTHYRYVHTSTYQEEVANRNAYPPALVRPSMDTIRPSRDEPREMAERSAFPTSSVRPSTDTSREETRPKIPLTREPEVLAPQPGSQNHSKSTSVDADAAAKEEMMNDPITYHWRQQRIKALDYAKQLPPLPQTPMSQDAGRTDSPDAARMEIGATTKTVRPDDRVNQVITPPMSTLPIVTNRTALPDYRLSRSELPQPGYIDGEPISPMVSSERPRRPKDSARSNSGVSITSSIKRAINLPTRTIMDLTGNDSEVFSEGWYAESEMSEPVVAVARSDSFRRLQPSLVTAGTKMGTDTGGQAASNEVVGSSPMAKSTAVNIPPKSPLRQPAASTFSPISTLVSVSPKNRPSTEWQSMAPGELARSPPQSRMSKISKLDSVAETEPELEPVQKSASKQVDVLDFQPSDTGRSPGPKRAPISSTRASSETRPIADSTSSPLKAETSQPSAVHSTPNVVQMSPESLNSGDFINPSHAFGVLTRDFADIPTKPAAPEPREPNVGAKVKQPARAANVSLPPGQLSSDQDSRPRQKLIARTPAYTSIFNEEEFARKREQARAALIRLQQSLDEDLMATTTQPIHSAQRSQVPRANGVPRSQSSTDGRPVAASAIFSHGRNDSAELEPDKEAAISAHNPNTSIHDFVTRTTSGNSVVTVKHIPKNNGKGKENKVETRGQRPTPTESQSYINRMNDLVQQAASLNLLPPSPHLNYIHQQPNGYNYSHPHVSASIFPPSPGEVSLSSFPIPHSRTNSINSVPRLNSYNHGHTQSANSALATAAAGVATTSSSTRHKLSSEIHRPLTRRGSMRSQASSNSAFSIPYHMIPDRSSSMRDLLVREEDGEMG